MKTSRQVLLSAHDSKLKLKERVKIIQQFAEDYAKEQKQRGWISVEDRMPEKQRIGIADNPIIVSTKEGKIFATSYCSLGWANLYGKEVTHWQPLPSPPSTN